MSDQQEVFGQSSEQSAASEENTLRFVIAQMLGRLATVTLVQVQAVANAGEVAPVGLVDVVPMAHQLTGDGQPIPHGVIHDVPYLRVQGGTNAVILDPQTGDIGIALFCSSDVSAIKTAKAPSPPSSRRKFDWADALYIGGVLNGSPVQWVRFSASGLELVSPTQITLQAPTINLKASGAINADSPATALTGGGTSIDGKPFLPHEHTGVQSGSSLTGGVA